MDTEKIKIKLKKTLSEGRYTHSLGVSKEARILAERFGADIKKAELAGLVHDCAKGMDMSKSLDICKKHGVILDEETLKCPPVIHAPVGAVVAKYEYGISDDEILDAIRFHTTAGENMTILSKIIYIADMTEENRAYDGVEELRKLTLCDIDTAYYAAVKKSLLHNINKDKFIHPNTLYAWNETVRKN